MLRFTEGYVIGPTGEVTMAINAASVLQRSRIAEALGNKADAIRFAAGFVALYDRPSPVAKARVKEAREWIRRLGGVEQARRAW